MIQEIIAFIILGFAVLYLVHKFIYPISFLSGKKKKKACGSTDCGCD
ncbi:FeoB-associated Cys-rich membrane protein [Euzebyella marina]|nr:hypothetical protein [Euzebyella marina]|tara:strand:+ start:168 stop:308 length:141 start_codon:yes stop_codon:yes gene_type:complete